MTNKERQLLRQAIRYIHADDEDGGNYHAGMDILCELAGVPYKKVPANLRCMTPAEIMAMGNERIGQPFVPPS